MKPSTKLFFPLAMSLLLASCGGTTPAASSEPAESTKEPEASSVAPASSEEPVVTSEEPVVSSEEPVVTSEEPQPEHKDANVMDHEVTIYFLSNFSYQSTLDAIIEAFKAVEPNITVVNLKETGSYDDVKKKAISQLATGEHPDLFVGYPDAVQEIMQYNKVVKLDDYIDNPVYGWSDADKADIIENYLEEGRGYPLSGTYSVPFAKSTEALFYNQKMIGINLAGIDPTINNGNAISEDYLDNLTWEELFGHLAPALLAYDAAQPADAKLLPGTGYEHRIFGYDSDDNLFITLAQQYGYGYTSIDEYGEASLDFDNDGMKGLMKTFNQAYKDKYFFTKGSNDNNYTNYNFVDGSALFAVGSTGGAKYQYSENFETGVAHIPHPEGKEYADLINQGPALSILQHDDDRALASWLFYRFLTNEANTVKWAMDTAYAPVRYSALSNDDYLDYASYEGKEGTDKLFGKVASYVGNVGDTLYSSPVFKGSAAARTQVGSLFTKCITAETLDDTFLNDAFALAISNTKKEM